MIAADFEYAAPGSLEEALELLQGNPGARALAGGQSLIPVLKLRLNEPPMLVDLRRLDELREVRETDGEVVLGALVTHREVATCAPLREGGARALSEAAARIGDLQVRNRGTLGGSLCHADPAADYPAAALALEATLVAAGPDGRRDIPAADFFRGLWTTALEPGEILVEVRIPKLPEWQGAYRKLRQKASGFALVGAAAVVRAEGDRCEEARIGITGVGATPYRATAVEEALAGGELDAETVSAACDAAAEGVEYPQEDLHASGEYRRAMASVFARRAVLAAVGG